MNRRRFFQIGLGAIACGVSISSGCTSRQGHEFRVGLNLWIGNEPFFLANELGYYRGTSIRLLDYASNAEMNRALREGEIEAANLTLDETLLLAQTTSNMRIVLVVDSSNGADALIAKPTVENLSDLKGRKIGLEATQLGSYMLGRILDKAGLSIKDIQATYLGISEHKSAYLNNEVDAIVTFEPIRSSLLQEGAKVLFDSSQIPGEILDLLTVSSEALEHHYQDIITLVKGYYEALEYIQTNAQDARHRMAIREQISSEQLRKALHLVTFYDRQTNLRLLSQIDPTLIQHSNRLAKIMLAKKLLDREVSLAPLLTHRVIRSSQ